MSLHPYYYRACAHAALCFCSWWFTIRRSFCPHLVSKKRVLKSSTVPESTTLLPTEPHQPQTFPFPKREFGKKSIVKRSFQPSWFLRWHWIHYMETTDSAICIICAKAVKKRSFSGQAMLILPSLQRAFPIGKMLQSNLASMTQASVTRKLF